MKSRINRRVQPETITVVSRTPTPKTRAEFDEIHAARAVYFTAVRFLGYATYERIEGNSAEQVEELAAMQPAGRPWMIYAVTPEGMSVHLKNVPPTSYEKSSK